MTVEEIKSQYSMADIIRQYGLTVNRAGFIKCPFHTGDRTASLKVYRNTFNCYGCGANGDIFKFVQLMDNTDFKTAYLKLGGEYKAKKTLRDFYNLENAKKTAARKRQEELKDKKRVKFLLKMVDILQRDLARSEEGSKTWHYCLDHLELTFLEIEELVKKGAL